MRTCISLILLNFAFGLLCISWAADIPLKNFNSSTDLVPVHRHVHLHSDESKKGHDNETYVTENPHKGHDMSSPTVEHKHHTPEEFQNTEPETEIINFFDAANEGAVYDENREKDMHTVHLHHVKNADDLVHDGKLLDAPKERGYMDHSMDDGHGTHGKMVGHDSHDDHDHHMKTDMKMNMKMDMNNTKSHVHMMMMMMYFHTGIDEVILFKEWKISTVGGLLGSMVGIFLLAVIYEGLKYLREHLFKRYVSSIQFSTVAVTGESGRVTQVHKLQRHHMLSWPHALQTLLHVVQIILSYFLMLIFMTYNVWLCLAVVLGAGFGYFIFGWKKATVVDITEHCH